MRDPETWRWYASSALTHLTGGSPPGTASSHTPGWHCSGGSQRVGWGGLSPEALVLGLAVSSLLCKAVRRLVRLPLEEVGGSVHLVTWKPQPTLGEWV